MPRTRYSDEDKGRVLAALSVNAGNVKRTSRDTSVPEQTVRDWKKKYWEKTPSKEIALATEEALDGFVEQATRVRDKALERLEEKIDNDEANVKDLNIVVGTLTDKVRLAQGQATSRTETVASVDPMELGKAMMDFVSGALSAAKERADDLDVIDGEFREQAEALPPPE